MAPIDDIAKVIREAIIGALADREDELRAIAEAGGAKAAHDPLGDIGNIASVLNLLLDVIAVTQPEIGLPLKVFDEAGNAGGHLGRGFGSGYFLGYALFQFAAPYLNYITHAIADAAQSEIFDPATAARLVAHDVIPLSEGRSEAHGGGFDDPHFQSMVDDALTRPDVQTLMLLRNLDEISDADVVKALHRHGYDEFWLKPLQALRRYLLSPADLALANLRGNIDQTTLDGYARQLGVTDQDMQVLIENTGEPPGPEQLMEALRRGFIQPDRFERGIRQSRVRNEWLDVEHALTVHPMSIADAVRAVVEGHLEQSQGEDIAFHNGLERDHFAILVESWGRPLSHDQMLTLYHRGQATIEEVHQALRESDIKNKYIDKAVELGRRLPPERTIVSMVDHGVINHDDALQLLKEQGFTEADADRLIRLGAAQRTGAAKHLSRGDLVAMYEDRLMPRAEVVKRLVDLKYDHADAEAMLDLADFKAAASARKTTQKGIEASLKAHHITADQAKAELIKDGADAQQAQALIDQWLQQRGTPTRSITEKQIIDFTFAKLMTVDDARNRLLAMGFQRGDVEMILKYNGLVK